MAALQILAIPSAIAAVCALPFPQTHRFHYVHVFTKQGTERGSAVNDDWNDDVGKAEDSLQSSGLFRMITLSVRQLLASPDPQTYLAWIGQEGVQLFTEAFTLDEILGPVHVANTPGQRAADLGRVCRTMGWAIASATPLPSQGFRPRPLPPPGRNDACLCGSLRKFKDCCADAMADLPVFDVNMLGSVVVTELSRKQWAELPNSTIAPAMVVTAAGALCDHGRAQHALLLLEPWSRMPPPWRDEWAELLDFLGDLYLDLQKPRKRKKLALAMIEFGERKVQSKGWQRLCLMATDVGDETAALEAFESAQRLAPNDPNVALLEVTRLMGQGLHAKARERASFHARRLSRLPVVGEIGSAIDTLTQLASINSSPLVDGRLDALLHSDLSRLRTRLQTLAAPQLHLILPSVSCHDLSEIALSRDLVAALKRWRLVFGFTPPCVAWEQSSDAGALVDRSEDWLPLLDAYPCLADSFEVLDGLMQMLLALPLQDVCDIQAQVMERALALWTFLREAQPHAACAWVQAANRPALRLLAHYVQDDLSPRAERTFTWLQYLVEVLNPNDNHGLRERLAAVYLRCGEAAKALTLCERYPGDLAGMGLLHARALFELNRSDEAAAALKSAAQRNVHLARLLLARRAPAVPQVDSYALGSVTDARFTVASQFDLWRTSAAIKGWVSGVLTTLSGDGGA